MGNPSRRDVRVLRSGTIALLAPEAFGVHLSLPRFQCDGCGVCSRRQEAETMLAYLPIRVLFSFVAIPFEKGTDLPMVVAADGAVWSENTAIMPREPPGRCALCEK